MISVSNLWQVWAFTRKFQQFSWSHLPMVVCWHLSHWASQLSYLHLTLVIPLKATEQHLPLTWFKPLNTHRAENTCQIWQSLLRVKFALYDEFTHHPPSREWTSHCLNWRKAQVPCWQSRCKTGTWLTCHTGIPRNTTKHMEESY